MDLTNFESVMAFTDKCARASSTGLIYWLRMQGCPPFGRYDVVEDWETCLHTNNFGPGLLVIRLVPKMIETARRFGIPDPRIVVAASDVHYWTTFEDELVELANILARLLSKEYCTLE